MAAEQYGSLPFREQIEAFRERVPIPTRAWTDVYGRENDQAFAVAGANRQAIVEDFAEAVDRAISEGRTLAEFRADFDTIVARHGWAYNGSRGWRTRVIYDTNLRQSYAAGREAQMADPELRRARPYGLYRHGGSRDPRPHHLDKDGWVVPLDDPWWDVWTPQNGWGCSCKKYTLSDDDVERLGLEVRREPPPIEYEERTVGANGPSPRTVRVPVGIDPGFEHRPGAARLRGITPRRLEAPLAGARTAPDRPAPDLPPSARPAPEAPEADTPDAEVAAFLARFGVERDADADTAVFHPDPLGEILPISRQLFGDGETPRLGALAGSLHLLAEALAEPDEIWTALVYHEEAERWLLRRRYLAWRQAEEGERAVLFEWGRAGWAASVTDGDSERLDEWRRGVRLYRRGEEEEE